MDTVSVGRIAREDEERTVEVGSVSEDDDACVAEREPLDARERHGEDVKV